MNIFLKLLGKEEIKYFKTEKHCNNPPKKSLLKPKSLLIEIPKNIKKRKFGKEIQNLANLTDQNIIKFNQKKRYRNENNIIPLTKRRIRHNEIKFNSKKIFNNRNNNISSLNSEDNLTKTSININEINEVNENKDNVQYLNEQIISEKDNTNNINVLSKKENFEKITLIKDNKSPNKINNYSLKKINQEKNSSKNKYKDIDKNDKIITNKEEKKNEIKIIKVNILPVFNFKGDDKNNDIKYNLQRAKEYLKEIHQYLKTIESKGIALSNYMSLIQTDINEKMRIILINWLIEVHFKFRLLNETLFICINIIDRYLSQKNINRRYLQLLGITSLFIASKYEEIYAPSAKDLIYMTDNAYKIDEMIKMENDILGVLKFELTFPTSLRFLELYGDILNLDEINFFRCYYLNEVSLICYNLCGVCPSLIACVCLYLNLKSNIRLFKGYNEEELFRITGYKKTEINSCLNILINSLMIMDDPNNRFISIKKKYALDKYMKVSNEHYLIEGD